MGSMPLSVIQPSDASASAPPETAAARPSHPEVTPHDAPDASDEALTSPAGPTIRLDDRAYAAGQTCVQCGLCLPACPTYLETGNEADSPRGRIRQMLGLHDGDVPLTPLGKEHLDRCLDCRACETACPSGVTYHLLIEDAREQIAHREAGAHKLPLGKKLQRWVFFNVLTRPKRLRLALLPARLLQRVRLYGLIRRLGLTRLLPGTFARMERMLPDQGPLWPQPLPAHSRAGGMDLVVKMLNPNSAAEAQRTKATVGFFEGCIASVMQSEVHEKAAELLCAAGADVVSPPRQICCGAIHHHSGDKESAKRMARHNIDTYLPEGGPELDYIVTCVAGDGAMLRQYSELLADDTAYVERAQTFSSKVRDITEVLAILGLPQMHNRLLGKVTYHDACHLAHGQKVTEAPRQLLDLVPGLEVIPLPESDVCCGAAGTYNLTQPEMASQLAHRKLDRVAETGCQFVVSGNIGCNLHMQAQARAEGRKIKAVHPVELLHEAIFGGDREGA